MPSVFWLELLIGGAEEKRNERGPNRGRLAPIRKGAFSVMVTKRLDWAGEMQILGCCLLPAKQSVWRKDTSEVGIQGKLRISKVPYVRSQAPLYTAVCAVVPRDRGGCSAEQGFVW